jgi:uncharacterized membrane protein
MSTLVILFVSFFVGLTMNKMVLQDKYSIDALGRFALSIMLVFTGAAHFFKTEEMVQMMPDFVMYKNGWVYLTGVLELLAAGGLVYQRTTLFTSVALIAFFVLILPANIIGSMKRVELGGMENGPGYLYFRIPLQILFMLWTYYFGIRPHKKVSGSKPFSQA